MEMKPDSKNNKLMVVQETLDLLLSERLIPFGLTAQKVIEDGPGEYTVPFHEDSRIHSFRFSWKDGDSFKEVLRAAVSDCERRMG